MGMADFTETLIGAIAIGSLYALIALGYTMVYGILKIINFAHSDVVVWGAWISYLLATRLLPAWGIDPRHPQQAPPLWMAGVVLVGAMLACGLLGFAIERLAYRPLRHAPRLNVLITAIGVSLLLQDVGQLRFCFRRQSREDARTVAGLVRHDAGPRAGGGGAGRPDRLDRPGDLWDGGRARGRAGVAGLSHQAGDRHAGRVVWWRDGVAHGH